MSKVVVIILALIGNFTIVGQAVLSYGEVIDTVQCIEDESQSYAAYLPSYYTADKKWPVIFVFEPAARGSIPVQSFAAVAEELGYLIIASNNSKNGSWEGSFKAAKSMFIDGSRRFSIDSARIYTSGFSGGSRVAISLATLYENIAGVIGCGAGLANVSEYQPKAGHSFIYVGVVGNRDMNFLEHKELEAKFNSLGIINNRIIFSAGHQWPPSQVLREAVYWLDHKAAQKGIKVSDAFASDTLFDKMKSRGDSLYANERYIGATEVYNQMVSDFGAHHSLDIVKHRLQLINDSKKIQRINRRVVRLESRERTYQQKIDQAFAEIRFTRLNNNYDSAAKTKEWWFREADSLWSVTRSQNVDKSNSGYRLLNLIWAKFATSSMNAEEVKDYQMAIRLNEIWVYTAPNNVWGLWNMAKLNALAGNADQAFKYLDLAHVAGMKYKGSLQNPAFDGLRDDPRYEIIHSKLMSLER